jgi:coenzyme F420 biosynthesis associated uncharacterized protein
MGVVIDWKLARTVAEGVAALQSAPDPTPFEALAGPAEESRRLVGAYTGLAPAHPLPAAEPVDRAAWIETNLASLGSVMDPATERIGANLGSLRGPAQAAAGAVLAVEIGVLSGFLASRVLGQYEFPVLQPGAPARLLFVSPNLAQAAQSLPAEPDALLRWVALHETTHALQFGGVPWLRDHLAGMVRELMSALDVDPRALLRQAGRGRDWREVVEAVRDGGMVSLVVGPERRELMDRLQAFMAVLEGYAEHVMDAVGAELLPDLPRLRAALERRRRDRSGLLRLLEKLLGLDLKLRQYEQGKAFCDGVVARGGVAALNRVWESPSMLPTLRELDSPAGWLARVETARPAAA